MKIKKRTIYGCIASILLVIIGFTISLSPPWGASGYYNFTNKESGIDIIFRFDNGVVTAFDRRGGVPSITYYDFVDGIWVARKKNKYVKSDRIEFQNGRMFVSGIHAFGNSAESQYYGEHSKTHNPIDILKYYFLE